jgi:hypothetical protein
MNHLVESSQLCSPVAEEERVAGPQVELLLAQGQELPHLPVDKTKDID